MSGLFKIGDLTQLRRGFRFPLYNAKGPVLDRACLLCGKAYKVRECRAAKSKYCSRQCSSRAANRVAVAKTTTGKTRACKQCGKEKRVKLSHLVEEGNYCSNSCRGGAYSENYKGDRNPNWKGGISANGTDYMRLIGRRRQRAKDRAGDLPIPSEHDEQAQLMDWCREKEGDDPRYAMIFAIPNGAFTSQRTANRLSREGRKAGVPDMFLAVPVGSFGGLFIELKRLRGGRVSDVQRDWIARLAAGGYVAVVALGARAAIAIIEAYLAGALEPAKGAEEAWQILEGYVNGNLKEQGGTL